LLFAYIRIIFEKVLYAFQKATSFLVTQLAAVVHIVDVEDFVDFVAEFVETFAVEIFGQAFLSIFKIKSFPFTSNFFPVKQTRSVGINFGKVREDSQLLRHFFFGIEFSGLKNRTLEKTQKNPCKVKAPKSNCSMSPQ
jgi:hypothetical protein